MLRCAVLTDSFCYSDKQVQMSWVGSRVSYLRVLPFKSFSMDWNMLPF
jgi:hypothetical protein